MTKSKNLKFYVVLGIALLLLGYVVAIRTSHVFGANALVDGNRQPRIFGSSCNASTTRVTIGKDISAQVLGTSTGRAYARVSMEAGATTSAQLAFANGATVTGSNYQALNAGLANGASSSPIIEFGINTSFAYTGAVQGLSTWGTSTVLVTECWYGNDN